MTQKRRLAFICGVDFLRRYLSHLSGRPFTVEEVYEWVDENAAHIESKDGMYYVYHQGKRP
jgi:hypothetical protein